MTDNDLNRLVAAARGWTPNTKVVRTAIAHALVNEFEPPDVCTDPAAWGGFLVELKAARYEIELLILPGMPANVRIRKPGALQSGYGTDAEIGRAVARAFLGSV